MFLYDKSAVGSTARETDINANKGMCFELSSR